MPPEDANDLEVRQLKAENAKLKNQLQVLYGAVPTNYGLNTAQFDLKEVLTQLGSPTVKPTISNVAGRIKELRNLLSNPDTYTDLIRDPKSGDLIARLNALLSGPPDVVVAAIALELYLAGCGVLNSSGHDGAAARFERLRLATERYSKISLRRQE